MRLPAALTRLLIAGTAAAAFDWKQVRLADAESGDATTPAFDPNSVHDSAGFSEDADGWGFSLNNATSVDGAGEGASWIYDANTFLPGGFVLDGTTGMIIRGTQVTAFPDNKACWAAAGMSDNGGNLVNVATRACGMGFKRSLTINRISGFDRQSDNDSNASGMVKFHALYWPFADRFGECTGYALNVSDGYLQQTTINQLVPYAGVPKIWIAAGCESSIDDGPHFGKFKFEVAALKLWPNGTF